MKAGLPTVATERRLGLAWTLTALATLALPGCGRSDNEPTPLLVLTLGTYRVTTSIEGASCVETGHAPSSTLSLVSIPESLGSNWIFRVEDQPGATFELWIHATSGERVPYGVHGLVRGKAIISTSSPSGPITADFGNLGILTGYADHESGGGGLVGQVRFTDGSGNALTCTKPRWAFVRTGDQ
jgi:hypothetical protein